MKQWRPKDWDSNEMHLDMLRANIDDMDGGAFIEAGADAILEALYKLAEESPTKTFTIDSRVINIYREGK